MMTVDVAVSLAGIVLTTAIAIYAIRDVRSEAKTMLKLGRDLAYLKVKNEMVWEFIEPTESAHTPEIAKGLHAFGLLAQALKPDLPPDTIKTVVENEALEFAEELVKTGRARWRSGLDAEKVRKAMRSWRTEKSAERIKEIMGENKILS